MIIDARGASINKLWQIRGYSCPGSAIVQVRLFKLLNTVDIVFPSARDSVTDVLSEVGWWVGASVCHALILYSDADSDSRT